SNTATANVSVVDTEDPSTPGGLYANSIDLDDFRLNWSASSDNHAVQGYDIMFEGVNIGWTSGTYVNFDGLEPDETYAVRVRAFDYWGNNSSWSSTLYVTTDPNYAPVNPSISAGGTPPYNLGSA